MLDNETGNFLECDLERKERLGDDLWLLCITTSVLWKMEDECRILDEINETPYIAGINSLDVSFERVSET
jgi:hypothetical protein